MQHQLWGFPLAYYFVLLSIVLYRIPVIGKFFNIINTILHELGHALTALLLEGKVHKIEIFHDTSGVTVTQCKSKIGTIATSLNGYIFASTSAFVCFHLLTLGLYEALIIALSLLFFIVMILLIRNPYGWLWVLCFCGLNGFLVYHGEESYLEIAALFYATTILTESVFSPFIVLYLSFAHSEAAGDATNLQKFTHVPAAVWALLFCAYAIFIAYQIYINFFSTFAS